jgi:hypothetical protein
MYIDPSTGSIVFQMAIAGALAAAAALGRVRGAVVSFFRALGRRRGE